MHNLLRGASFEHAVTGVIAVNSVLLVWELFDHNEVTEHIESACLLFFLVELVVRWRRHQWNPLRFLRNPWNAFDVVVILAALLPLVGADSSLLRLARLSRAVHWLRHVSHLRLAPLLWSFLIARSTTVRVIADSPEPVGVQPQRDWSAAC